MEKDKGKYLYFKITNSDKYCSQIKLIYHINRDIIDIEFKIYFPFLLNLII